MSQPAIARAAFTQLRLRILIASGRSRNILRLEPADEIIQIGLRHVEIGHRLQPFPSEAVRIGQTPPAPVRELPLP